MTPFWIIACAGKVGGPEVLRPTVALQDPTAEVLALQGISFEWRSRPHRVSHLEFGVEPAEADAPGRLVAEVRGGDWASGEMALDSPSFVTRLAYVESPSLYARRGTVHLTVSGELSDRHEAEGGVVRATIEVPADRIAATTPLAVVLTGFIIDSSITYESGYTLHALGIELGEPVLEGDQVRFDVVVRVQPGPVPDRRQKLRTYGATVQVDWALLAPGEGHASRWTVDQHLKDNILPGRLRIQPTLVPVEWETKPDTLRAVSLLSGFQLDVTKDGWVAGRYLRAITAGVEDERFNALRDSYQADVALRFANTGPAQRRVPAQARATFTLLELGSDATLETDRWITDGLHQREEVAFPSLQSVEDHPASADEPAIATP